MPISTAAIPTTTRWRSGGIALFCVAAFLLISMGGAIVAAPVTIPLMFVAVRRHPTSAFRTVGSVLIGATAAEATWALTYVAVGETQPWIWLAPIAASIAVIVAAVVASAAVSVGRAESVAPVPSDRSAPRLLH